MSFRNAIAALIPGVLISLGCASTNITQRESDVGNQRLPRPGNILIYDFAATMEDLPADAAFAGQIEQAPQTAQQIAEGRTLGTQVANELAADIRAMGLPSQAVSSGAYPQVGDIVIKGYFLSIDQGSAIKRMVIGFGEGGAELKTVVEGYEMTPQGLRKLGSGTVEADPGKAPGLALPAAVAIASGNPIGLIVSSAVKVEGQVSGRTTIEGRAQQTAKEVADALKPQFEQQGWISD
jgi:Domain of unknown function (DUF4410)